MSAKLGLFEFEKTFVKYCNELGEKYYNECYAMNAIHVNKLLIDDIGMYQGLLFSLPITFHYTISFGDFITLSTVITIYYSYNYIRISQKIFKCINGWSAVAQSRLTAPCSCQIQHFGKLRQVDHLRSGVRNQPGQHGKTPSLLKIQKLAGHGG
ncbi:Zinc finger protein 714, partial [Plecturocebus cupreus]